MKRIERIRLYPTGSQTKALHFMLDVTRELYNALLEERRDAWRRRRVAIGAKEQYAEITALRSERGGGCAHGRRGRSMLFVADMLAMRACAAESRRRRRFFCVRCKYAVHADVNAALVIRRRAELRPAGSGASLEDREDLRSVLSPARTRLRQHDAA